MPSDITVRTLGLEDYTRWMSLWQRAGLHSIRPRGRDSREAMATQLAGGSHAMLGLERGGELLAVVLVTHDGRKGWINRLAVLTGERQRGHAARLVQAAEELLKGQGIHVISVLIEPGNDVSLSFFRHMGYVESEGMHYLSKRDGDEA